MQMTLVLLLAFVGGDTYSGKVPLPGIGSVALPRGDWLLERTSTPDKSKGEPDVFVFKKVGPRLERLTFQRFGPHISHPIEAYFDSIGDSTSNGIPIHLLNRKNEHDAVHIMKPVYELELGCKASSYIYTSETKDPWISHAFVNDRKGWILVCVHASPHVLSPDAIDSIYHDSEFLVGESKPLSAK